MTISVEQEKAAIVLNFLTPPTSDGCSDGGLCALIDKILPGFKQAMTKYCVEHDKDYGLGKYSGKTRLESDNDFLKASEAVVNELGTSSRKVMAINLIRRAYWAGVRLGGWIPLTSFRWGFRIKNDEGIQQLIS